MSDTKRWVKPGWGPSHPDWRYGPMTDKHQQKDRSEPQSQRRRRRFRKGARNSRHNLSQKNEGLSAAAEHDLANERYATPAQNRSQ